MEEQSDQEQEVQKVQPEVYAQPVATTTSESTRSQSHASATKAHSSLAASINRVTALTLIVTALLFALISIMAIWEVFGPDTGNVVWRSFSSLATIAFAALIVNVGTKLLDQYMVK